MRVANDLKKIFCAFAPKKEAPRRRRGRTVRVKGPEGKKHRTGP